MSDPWIGEDGAAAAAAEVAVEGRRRAQRTFPDLVICCEDGERHWESMEEEDDLGRRDGSLHDFEGMEDDDDETPPERQIVVGICAMTKKSNSKAMTQILERLCLFDYISVVIFPEETVLGRARGELAALRLRSFPSTQRFPLDKAVEYVKLRNPLLINDLNMQYFIQDRYKMTAFITEMIWPPERQIVVGICAMTKKSNSKAMTQILERLCLFDYISVVIFPEETVLDEPVENWPLCDCLISFHSKGFPLDKAVEYVKLRNPLLINDLNMQYFIQDRREVYRILQEEGIDLPRYAVLNRDPHNPDECSLVECEDHVEVNGEVFPKPFVEKPVCAEDHNVYIYYPTSAGGGSQRLFRKVYTVGPDYAHAEARKSPALDGKVERDSEGKEIRYPVMLTAMEKLVARKVCLAFKQTVCGFDLLRANGHSYVCDVNGFSFVKNSMKYYDDCAKVLGNLVMRELAPQFHIPWSIPLEAEDIPIVPTTSGTMMELRCVIAIIRHGDRTPKQKMKMEVRHPLFFELFEKCGGYKSGKLKLKKPKQLQEVLDIARLLLVELEQRDDCEIEEKKSKLEQLKTVLEMEGPSLLLVLKWGGELTPAGRVQAEELGRAFRCMYPGGKGDYAGFPGCGLLRLHSTYRHDLKIYASDEGRVQMTAAAFAKGLLALEGELTPILVQMVKSANMNGLLDSDSDSLTDCQQKVKARLHEIMQKNQDFTDHDYHKLAPTGSPSLVNSMKLIQNPVHTCDQVHALIQSLTSQIRKRLEDPKSAGTRSHLSRWSKLERDFRMKSGRYDISKIPDIYDCVKYSRGVMSPGRHVRTRLYFTSESHVHSLLSVFRYGGLLDEVKDQQWKQAMDYLSAVSELNYMTQIVIMLYEDNNKPRGEGLRGRGERPPGLRLPARLLRGDYAGFPGCGLLRLHSTYRHDLKIYASDEGRVQMTAAAFAKGLLALEGELTPILVQMVKSANMNGLLDSDSDSLTDCQQKVKARLHEIMQKNQDFTDHDYHKLAPTGSPSLVNSMKLIQNPVHTCDQVHALIQSLTSQIRKGLEDPNESLELMLQRWSKLERDFRMKSGRYDISKIPDIYDCVKYSRGVMSPGRHVRTRLYFTSESHVHSLLSVFRYGGLLDEVKDQQWKQAMDYLSAVSELNYMTQIVIMLYEDNNKGCEDEENVPLGFGFRPASSENEEKQTDQGSLEDLSQDQVDQALPLSEPIYIQRRSPMIRNRKTGSMEVLSETSPTHAKGSSISTHRLFPSVSRHSPEIKPPSGLGSLCSGLFSASVLGVSSSAPNLRDYVRTHHLHHLHHRKPPLSPGSLPCQIAMFGFEGCSMVPSIYPLETLHNSLSLKQVDQFLNTVCESSSEAHAKTMKAPSSPCPPPGPRPPSDPPADLYGSVPSSTVSSAGPSSPITEPAGVNFSFSE
ncbi:hypothetical protein CRUP_031096 [Coryphaenoides rupestris]|nr:hypothetical protein CRUP_031096 [Coryphaenoides rupestris]